ncbi:MAG: hypothetical protein ACRDZY_04430, partial [Acidimicrobiales bacterium]
VLARNATKPAFELGFTSVSFAQPAASNFTFTPPKGAKVTTHTIPAPAPTGSAPTGSAPTGSAPTVLGHGWDAIAVLPPGSLSEAMGSGPTPGSASSSTSPPGGNGGRSAGALRALLQGATPVTVNGAQAKLVTTSLVDALVLPDGQVLVGSVTPAALEAAASHLA